MDIFDFLGEAAAGPWRFMICIILGLIASICIHHYIDNTLLAWIISVPVFTVFVGIGWKWSTK